MDQVMFGGRYQAEHFVGVPGRLDAYSGIDTSSQAKVAIITSIVSGETEASDWTLRAQNIASFSHADVARLLDWGREGDTFFVVEEWIAGQDAGTLVAKSGPVAADRVAAYGSQVAAGLAAAHGHGIVHGDIRPDDIVIREDGQAVLAGVGAPGALRPWAPAPDTPPTAARFLSPEQCAGGAATPQSDIYSLGVVLYYMVTGQVPFDGPDATTVCAQQQDTAVQSPRAINPYIPAPLEAVIMRALAKSPVSRYGSAEEMRLALEAVAAGGAGQTQVMPIVPVEEPKKRKVWPWVLAIVLVVLLALAGVAAAWWLGYIGGVSVPDLTGMTPTQATTTLEDAGLVLGSVDASQQYPQGTKVGTIFEQTPTGGRPARKGSIVSVVLAGGETVRLPNLVGMSESEALNTLTNAGFTSAPVQRKFDSKVDAGLVISQTPEANSDQLKGSAVTITVSKGAETASVPSVLNKTEAAATNAIEDAGFKLQVQQIEATNVPKGQVANQSPGGGVKADVGSTVTIFISTGTPQPKQVTVPDVVGQTQNEALTTLQNLGLKVTINDVTASQDSDKGKVMSQDPGANSTVDVGATVTIQVGN
ncbi:MAG: PASTA domain-containing protein [Coriobacteriales bacterium]|nr:PASTA domain-containing protein [Coriobacteriales bacterium]